MRRRQPQGRAPRTAPKACAEDNPRGVRREQPQKTCAVDSHRDARRGQSVALVWVGMDPTKVLLGMSLATLTFYSAVLAILGSAILIATSCPRCNAPWKGGRRPVRAHSLTTELTGGWRSASWLARFP